ncbi:MAG: twin-arginine translocation signal domain-containing protein [Chloroflexi bacterium]|nr:twin-arginine translocation signal domain-containing protein [Chloroflexota bacterium]
MDCTAVSRRGLHKQAAIAGLTGVTSFSGSRSLVFICEQVRS